MEESEVPAIPGGVQSRRGFRDVLADDGGVADLFVAEAKLVVSETDGFGVVGLLGMPERSTEQSDRPRLLPLGKRNAAMEPPQRGEQRGRKALP